MGSDGNHYLDQLLVHRHPSLCENTCTILLHHLAHDKERRREKKNIGLVIVALTFAGQLFHNTLGHQTHSKLHVD